MTLPKSKIERLTKPQLVDKYLDLYEQWEMMTSAAERRKKERNEAEASVKRIKGHLQQAQSEASDWNSNYNIADRERSELRDLLDTALATIRCLQHTIASLEQAAAERHQAEQLHRQLNVAVEEFQDEFNAYPGI